MRISSSIFQGVTIMYWGFVVLCSFALIYLSSCSVLGAKDGIGFDILEFDGGKETVFEEGFWLKGHEEGFWLRGQFFYVDCRANSRNIDELPYIATPLTGAEIQVTCRDPSTSVRATTNDFGIFVVEIPDSNTFDISLKTKCSLHLISSMVTKSNSKEVHIGEGPLGDHVFTRVHNSKAKAALYEMQRFDYASTTCEWAPLYKRRRQLEQVDNAQNPNSPYGSKNGIPAPPSPPNSLYGASNGFPVPPSDSPPAPPRGRRGFPVPPSPPAPPPDPIYPDFPPYEPPSPPPPCDCPCNCLGPEFSPDP